MPKGFENVGKGNDVISRLAFDLEGFVSAAGLEGLISANWFLVAPANETAGGNSTSTPPPEQFESAAREILVPVSLLGAAAAGMIAMML
jgi:hypothetical protein